MGNVAQKYLERCSDRVAIFTDGPKDPGTGRTGVAVCTPENKVNIQKRCTDHLSEYSVELTAVMIALQWTEEQSINKSVIVSEIAGQPLRVYKQ